MEIVLKRAYEPPSGDDGLRILVERLWPRGVSKEALAIDHWMKEIAPSNELRRWYDHKPERWDAFQDRYKDELRENRVELDELKSLVGDGRVCFVLATRDVEHSGVAVLKAFLETGG